MVSFLYCYMVKSIVKDHHGEFNSLKIICFLLQTDYFKQIIQILKFFLKNIMKNFGNIEKKSKIALHNCRISDKKTKIYKSSNPQPYLIYIIQARNRRH